MESALGVLWKKPWSVFWLFIFWVFEVDFLRAGVEGVGVETEAEEPAFAMLTQGPPARVREVSDSQVALLNYSNCRTGAARES